MFTFPYLVNWNVTLCSSIGTRLVLGGTCVTQQCGGIVKVRWVAITPQ